MFVPLVGIAGLATAVSLGYHSMSPTGQWYGRTFTGLPAGSEKLALTFDDGPNDPHTLRLLEVLAKHEVRATFFLIGEYAKKRPDIVREIAKSGHVIGNHTFSHPNLIFASSASLKSELQQCQDVISEIVGEPPRLFRPPWGGRRPGTLQIVRSLGLEPVMWNVTGYDWKGRPADYVERKIHDHVRGGDVILLHDGSHAQFGADRSQTVIAADQLIAHYKSKDFEFVTIPEMMKSVVSN